MLAVIEAYAQHVVSLFRDRTPGTLAYAECILSTYMYCACTESISTKDNILRV